MDRQSTLGDLDIGLEKTVRNALWRKWQTPLAITGDHTQNTDVPLPVAPGNARDCPFESGQCTVGQPEPAVDSGGRPPGPRIWNQRHEGMHLRPEDAQ